MDGWLGWLVGWLVVKANGQAIHWGEFIYGRPEIGTPTRIHLFGRQDKMLMFVCWVCKNGKVGAVSKFCLIQKIYILEEEEGRLEIRRLLGTWFLI